MILLNNLLLTIINNKNHHDEEEELLFLNRNTLSAFPGVLINHYEIAWKV